MTGTTDIYNKINDLCTELLKFHHDQSEVLFSLRYIDNKITSDEYNEQHSLLDAQLTEKLIEGFRNFSWEEQIYFMSVYSDPEDVFGPYVDETQMSAARLMRA